MRCFRQKNSGIEKKCERLYKDFLKLFEHPLKYVSFSLCTGGVLLLYYNNVKSVPIEQLSAFGTCEKRKMR